MALDSVLKELANLSPEEQKSLRALFGAPAVEEKKKNPPEAPRAQVVYFFEQLEVFSTVKTVIKDDKVRRTVDRLPPRVIAVDEKMASKLYWKSRKFRYLGRSDGRVWSKSRGEGKTVAQAQALEYKAMLKSPDLTAPPNNEKTFFRGTKVAQLNRGQEIPWSEGVKQGLTTM